MEDNRSRPNLKFLSLKSQSDYKLTTSEGIGICEVKGNHPERKQEDAIAVDVSETSATFMAMTESSRKQVMETTFAGLQKTVSSLEGGSCACVATAHVLDGKATVFTSYLGDSVAFLIVLKANGALKSVTACNPELHDGYNPKECKAIEEGIGRSKGRIFTIEGDVPRLSGTLAVTRAFGDTIYDDAGISHKPQTTTVTQDVAPDDRVYMIVTCDGAMEYCKGLDSVQTFAKELGELVAENHHLSPEALAEHIVDNALGKGSFDNITAMVIPLQHNKTAVTAAVFDGHGGSDVSKALSEQYTACFAENVFGFVSKYISNVFKQYFGYNTGIDLEVFFQDKKLHDPMDFDK